jgi:hypothetical protein
MEIMFLHKMRIEDAEEDNVLRQYYKEGDNALRQFDNED